MAKTGALSEDSPRRRRWPRRLAIGSAVAVALFAVVGFLVAPPIARHVAEKQLGDLLGRKVSIARVRINPFALSLTVEGFQIFEPDQVTPFCGFSRLYVNAQLSSVFRRAPVIKEIALEALRVHLVRTRATADAWADVGAAYNFSDILARLSAAPSAPKTPEPPPSPGAPPPRFSLNNIHVSDGALIFDDRPSGDHHEVTDLAIGVPFVSTLPVYLDSFVEPGLGVRIDGTPFQVKGRTKPFKDSLETVLELRLQALDLTRYLPFVPARLPFSVDSARLSLALDVAFVRPGAGAPRVTVKGDVALDKLALKEKRKPGPTPLVALDRVAVNIGEADVSARQFRITAITVSGLDLHLRRQRDGSLNLAHLAPPGEKHAPDDKEEAAGVRFSLERFALDKTTLHFRDESVEPAFESEVRDVVVSVRGLSNAPGATAAVQVGLRAVPGGTLSQQGTLRLTPLAASGKVTVEGIEPGRFAPYYRDLVAFAIGSGRLRLGAGYTFEQERARTTVRVEDGFVELDDLALRRRGARQDFFRLAALAVRGASLDLGRHTVQVAEISTREGRLRAARDARGVVDLSTLVPPPPAGAGGAAPPAAGSAAAGAPPAKAPAWTVAVARFDLERWGVRVEDHAVVPTAILDVDPIALHVTELSTAPGAKLGLDLRLGINKTGRLQVSGTSTLPPLTANLRVDLRALELLPFQPYLQDQVSFSITGGTVAVKAQAAVKQATGAAPQLKVEADIDVADLATVDRDRQEPLLKWRSLHVGALHVASAPLAVAIGEVALTDFHSRVVLDADGRLNLEQAMARPGAAAPRAPAAKVAPFGAPAPRKASAPAPAGKTRALPAEPPPAISIAQVRLQGGQVSFSDRSLRPAYTADLGDLSGRISGLSSVPGSTADVDIRGSVNRSGVLTIAGKANPLAQDLALDVQVDLRDVELPPASPYAGKYAGYAISKGKLDLALTYKIADRKLQAQNKLVLDQFTFGDKVDSADAVKLPVRLAVALLKDRRGIIDIDLPIAGSLDDPEFTVWRAVLKVLGNLVVKAVTAPFSLLASAFGGGDELSRIDFTPGLSALEPTAQKRLATLSRALRERPGISFEIEGGADPRQDRDGLRRVLYERKLKARKSAALVQAGAPVPSLDDLKIDPNERPSLLAAAYQVETFPKPKDGLGLTRTLPPAEMEKLIVTNIRVDDDELRALALRRATLVQSALARSLPGAASRLFLVTPRLGGPGGHVEFKLKKD